METIVFECRDVQLIEVCCLAFLERLLTCCVGAKDGFISFEGRLETEELIFREKNGKGPK